MGDTWRKLTVSTIERLEKTLKRDAERLELLKQQLAEYDAKRFEVFDCAGVYPRVAAPALLKFLGRAATVGEIIEKLLEGDVKVGLGRPEVNIRIALTILVKSGKLLLNEIDARTLSSKERSRLTVKDEDLLSLPP